MSSQENNNILVSIITVDYNGHEMTFEFLKSINQYLSDPEKIEIIIVDNGSKKDYSKEFKELNSTVKVIRSEENLGFSGGNNLGIKEAKGEFLFFVNNDTEFTEGLVDTLIDTLRKHPDVGAVSPKIKFYDTPEILQYAGFAPFNFYTGRTRAIGSLEKDNNHIPSGYTNSLHGAAMMVKREVIDNVGFMPEMFFLYYEEWDWCHQIKTHGYKLYYEAGASIFHKESMSTGKNSPLKTYYITRNRILFVRRNATFWQKWFFTVYLISVAIPKNTLEFILDKNISNLKSFYKGVFWNLNNRKLVS
ncbi:glycosyltransferase family 2 protein [Fulvivirga ligni]|uniref:glycosyltransferase family 2 protein n=1 Tax=Fulvivirga ligni TaxID=2904246 RepID=UPI001F42240E|nr:glycosyltransferase family 2 protein [Fulvivirga ligni]UII19708.1 glycosyltransferase family 2 protein [Fulvivirga ligni]